MHKQALISKLFLGLAVLFAMSLVHARIPVWSFIPLTPTTLTVAADATATVQYTVTNQSNKQHSLWLRPIPGITQTSAAGNCSNPVVLKGHQSILCFEFGHRWKRVSQ